MVFFRKSYKKLYKIYNRMKVILIALTPNPFLLLLKKLHYLVQSTDYSNPCINNSYEYFLSMITLYSNKNSLNRIYELMKIELIKLEI
jgi:hypothetical protein